MYSVHPTLRVFRPTVQRVSYRLKSLSLCVHSSLNIVFFLVPRCYNLTACHPLFLGATMASHVLNFVREYVERLQGMPFVPRISYGRSVLRGTSPRNSDQFLVPMLI